MKSYDKNGFYLAKGLLDLELVDNSITSLKSSFDKQLELLRRPKPENIYTSMQNLHSLDIDRYKGIIGGLWRKLSIYNLAHHQNIVEFVKGNFKYGDIYIPGGQVVHIQSNKLKIPGGYFGLPAHQDYPSIQGSLDGMVILISLVSQTEKNFPLKIIPGSHKNGLLPMVPGEAAYSCNSDYFNESDFVSVIAEAGDVFL